jgi:hypothetical protein
MKRERCLPVLIMAPGDLIGLTCFSDNINLTAGIVCDGSKNVICLATIHSGDFDALVDEHNGKTVIAGKVQQALRTSICARLVNSCDLCVGVLLCLEFREEPLGSGLTAITY